MQQRHQKIHNSSLLCTIYAERLCIHIINSFYQNIFIKLIFQTCKVLSLQVVSKQFYHLPVFKEAPRREERRRKRKKIKRKRKSVKQETVLKKTICGLEK